jgi:hypothetical protein
MEGVLGLEEKKNLTLSIGFWPSQHAVLREWSYPGFTKMLGGHSTRTILHGGHHNKEPSRVNNKEVNYTKEQTRCQRNNTMLLFDRLR